MCWELLGLTALTSVLAAEWKQALLRPLATKAEAAASQGTEDTAWWLQLQRSPADYMF